MSCRSDRDMTTFSTGRGEFDVFSAIAFERQIKSKFLHIQSLKRENGKIIITSQTIAWLGEQTPGSLKDEKISKSRRHNIRNYEPMKCSLEEYHVNL